MNVGWQTQGLPNDGNTMGGNNGCRHLAPRVENGNYILYLTSASFGGDKSQIIRFDTVSLRQTLFYTASYPSLYRGILTLKPIDTAACTAAAGGGSVSGAPARAGAAAAAAGAVLAAAVTAGGAVL